ncbi:MAG: carbohydrate binding domain-containing protein [Stenotrophomonas sp.]|uniref:carbohydrate binding domain-containing protein n=1 Tax=Stenotrophomonas sp. TaxID=69392 RepID=UPI003D6D3AAA
MTLRLIDLDTPRPNNHRGDPTRTANAITNENMQEIGQRLNSLEDGGPAVGQRLDALEQEQQQLGDVQQQLGQAQAATDELLATSTEAIGVELSRTASRIVRRSRLINGNFDIAQERVSGTVTAAAPYTADQWQVSSSAPGVTCNWGIGAPAVGEIKGATRFLGYNVVAGAGSAWMGQRIEGVQTLANGKATVSFWMRSNIAGKKVGLTLQQVFGSGGSGTVQTDGDVVTLTTKFAKYTYTFDVPSIAGKIYGANHNLFLLFFLCDGNYFDGQLANQSGLFELAQVKLEDGDTATPYDFRDVQEELQDCEWFWRKSYDIGVSPGAISAFGRCGEFISVTRTGASAHLEKFPTRMRTTPAVVIYASESGAVNQVSQHDGTNTAVNSLAAVGETGFQVSYTNAAGKYGASFHYTANARL